MLLSFVVVGDCVGSSVGLTRFGSSLWFVGERVGPAVLSTLGVGTRVSVAGGVGDTVRITVGSRVGLRVGSLSVGDGVGLTGAWVASVGSGVSGILVCSLVGVVVVGARVGIEGSVGRVVEGLVGSVVGGSIGGEVGRSVGGVVGESVGGMVGGSVGGVVGGSVGGGVGGAATPRTPILSMVENSSSHSRFL